MSHFTEFWTDHSHLPWLRLRRPYAEIYPRQPHRGWRLEGRIPEVWYYVQCALWRQHNVIKIPTLSPTYHDKDTVLLHGMMAIFCRFMETEKEQIWTSDAVKAALAKDEDSYSRQWYVDYLPVAQEMETLYHWWKIARPAREKAEAEALHVWHEAFEAAGGMTFGPSEGGVSRAFFGQSKDSNRLFEIHRQLEEAGEQDDEDMLIRLVKIRRHLWT